MFLSCEVDGMLTTKGANLLGQDQDLHYEDTAEYQTGTGYVVLECRKCRGPVLLREAKRHIM